MSFEACTKLSNGFIAEIQIKGDHTKLYKMMHYVCNEALVLSIVKPINNPVNISDEEYNSLGRKREEYSLDKKTLFRVGEKVKNVDFFPSCERAFFWRMNLDNYTGEHKTYHDTGHVEYHNHYKDGKLDGECSFYSYYGRKIWTRNYKQGSLDGDYAEFSHGGKVEESGHYTDGRLNGEQKIFLDDGTLVMTTNFKDGKKNGRYAGFYKDGKPRFLFHYRDGVEYGEFKKWLPTGQLLEHCYRKEGEYNGEYLEWHGNGKLWCKIIYKNGEYDGEYKVWSDEGELICDRVYKGGELQSSRIPPSSSPIFSYLSSSTNEGRSGKCCGYSSTTSHSRPEFRDGDTEEECKRCFYISFCPRNPQTRKELREKKARSSTTVYKICKRCGTLRTMIAEEKWRFGTIGECVECGQRHDL